MKQTFKIPEDCNRVTIERQGRQIIQRLFDAMAKDGKRWNAEAKQVEDIKTKRWRAKKNEQYYTLDDYFEVCESEENNDHIDEKRYKYGFYFQTEQQAEAAAEKIKELLKQINS